MVAVDTGFFIAMMRGSHKAVSLWQEMKKNKIKPVMSSLSIGELVYILYREGKEDEEIKGILIKMVRVIKVIDTSSIIATKGAEIKHKTKIPYIDSLITATAIMSNCKTIYTSDRKHMENIKDYYDIDVVIVREEKN